jgi:hypothetical protein
MLDSPHDGPQHWRDAPAVIRRMIEGVNDQDRKQTMARIAEQYERLAERPSPEGKPKTP